MPGASVLLGSPAAGLAPNRQGKGKTWQKIWLPAEADGLLIGIGMGEVPASEIGEKVVIGSGD